MEAKGLRHTPITYYSKSPRIKSEQSRSRVSVILNLTLASGIFMHKKQQDLSVSFSILCLAGACLAIAGQQVGAQR